MFNNKSIRAEAWALTKANFWKLFGLMLVTMLAPVVIIVPVAVLPILGGNEMASVGGVVIVYLAMLIAMPVLTTGVVRMILTLHRSGELRVSEIFYYITSIKRYGKAILLMLAIGVITLVCNIIPVLGQILLIWLTFRLILATWLFVSDDRLSVIECIKFSFELMKGHCWRMFCMMFMLGLICVGILLVCTVPVAIIGAISEAVFVIFLAAPLVLVGYSLVMPFYILSIAGFAAELMPNVGGAPAELLSSSPEL